MNCRDRVAQVIVSLDEAQSQYVKDLAVKELRENFDSRQCGRSASNDDTQEELMFAPLLSDGAHLHANLQTVGKILGCKETFMEIFYGEPVSHDCVKTHIKVSNALASAMQDIAGLMRYHEGHRADFDVREGFAFECGA